MDTFAVKVFLTAANAGNLSAAARQLGITAMSATRRLAGLEAELGARLLHRTTRATSLTAEGEAFLPFASTVVEAAEAGRAEIFPSTAGAGGLLRVTAPGSLASKVIIPQLPAFLRNNRDLKLDLLLTDTQIEMVSTGVDVAVRVAALADTDRVATLLAHNTRTLCAAPAYIAQHGQPERLADLSRHVCITASGRNQWRFLSAGAIKSVKVEGRISATSTDGQLDACVAGLGLALLSTWHSAEDVAAGRLVSMQLEDATPEVLPIWAMYPTRRHLLPKVKLFVEMMRQALAGQE